MEIGESGSELDRHLVVGDSPDVVDATDWNVDTVVPEVETKDLPEVESDERKWNTDRSWRDFAAGHAASSRPGELFFMDIRY